MAERRILEMICQTEQWQMEHSRKGRTIDAAACAIRLRALKDALAALSEHREETE